MNERTATDLLVADLLRPNSPIYDSSRGSGNQGQQGHSTALDPVDMEFLKIDAVDELLRFPCAENESTLISMLRTWRSHSGLPKLTEATLKKTVQMWVDMKIARIHRSFPRDTSSIRPHRKNVVDTRPVKIRDDQLLAMEDVDHLCYTLYREGLPCLMKTVIDPLSDTIYDFKVEVRQSLIDDAGLGLFLTFIGARSLKPDVKNWSQLLKSNRHILHVPTQEELVARLPDDTSVLVKLKGKNLHGNQNNPVRVLLRLRTGRFFSQY